MKEGKVMPKQTTKSGLAQKYGGRLGQYIAAHKDDETDPGVMDPPPGIKQGVAQITDCYFKQYESGDNKGEYFFRAAGRIVEPDKVGVKRAKGLYTSVMEPCCDTKKKDGTVVTQEEHVAVILNHLRLLGADVEGADENTLEAIAEAVKEAAPYFSFSTSQGEPTTQFPNPRLWQNWHGTKGLEDYQEDSDDGVKDNSGSDKASSNGQATKPKAAGGKVKTQEVPFGDKLDMLVEKANAEDEEAGNELTAKAVELGIDAKKVANAKDWDQVADWIREKMEGETESSEEGSDEDAIDYEALGTAADEEMANEEEGDAIAKLKELAEAASIDPDDYGTWSELATTLSAQGEESEEPSKPIVGQVWYYHAKGSKKSVEVEILKIFKNDSADVKDLDTGKTVKAVPFAQLSADA